MKRFSIVIVDDHNLFSNSLKRLVESYADYEVVEQFRHGNELLNYIVEKDKLPDLILLDVRMPIMNGIDTMKWLKENKPSQKVLVLSMEDNDETIIEMLRFGARGYVIKDINPNEFKTAMDEVIHNGYYYTNRVTQTLLNEVIDPHKDQKQFGLNDREFEFLILACTERTYKEIASDMFLSPKTIDGYRESLFKKLNAKSRIGLVLFALKNKIVKF